MLSPDSVCRGVVKPCRSRRIKSKNILLKQWVGTMLPLTVASLYLGQLGVTARDHPVRPLVVSSQPSQHVFLKVREADSSHQQIPRSLRQNSRQRKQLAVVAVAQGAVAFHLKFSRSCSSSASTCSFSRSLSSCLSHYLS